MLSGNEAAEYKAGDGGLEHAASNCVDRGVARVVNGDNFAGGSGGKEVHDFVEGRFVALSG